MFQTTNNVLPRRYSHRRTMLPRMRFAVEVWIVLERHGSEIGTTSACELADVVVVADGDERLQEHLERHVARERVRAPPVMFTTLRFSRP